MPKRMHVTGVRDDEPYDFDVELVDRMQARRRKREDDAFQKRLASAIQGGWEKMPVANPNVVDVLFLRISPPIIPDHAPQRFAPDPESPRQRVSLPRVSCQSVELV